MLFKKSTFACLCAALLASCAIPSLSELTTTGVDGVRVNNAKMTDQAKDIARQVDALLAQMTLEEKIGQLNQHAGFSDPTGPVAGNAGDQIKVNRLKEGLVGSMLNVVGAKEVRETQKLAVENSRLGIPVIFGFDVIHGHQTMFPLPLAEAASWDLDAVEQGARIAALEASAQGLNWTFAPMVDISRDPRWGRVMEGAGEDPYLGSAMAVARVRGFQGNDLASHDTLAATAKHFAAYGFTEAGRDYTRAIVDTMTLHNIILPPFKAAVEAANVRTIMNSFNTMNGMPATASTYLQRDILKGEWGFTGFVVSDWGSVIEMVPHGFAEDKAEAAEFALNGGSDMEMETGAFIENLGSLVKEGKVDIANIDDAVRRILTVKYELGLFEDPYRYVDAAREKALLGAPAHLTAAKSMAERSVVLLKNERNLLPLSGNDKIAIIGALADDKDTPLGNWRGKAIQNSAVTVLEGFEAANIPFTYSKGADVHTEEQIMAEELAINETDRSGFREAVQLAARADKVIMVLGEAAMQSGEARSRARLDFPGVQQELLEAIHEVNPNIILVVMSGRPLVLTWADENVPTIVQAWHLGSQSGHALASVLSGEYNPSGKLPMTFPRSLGQVPIYYNTFNTGRPGPLEAVWWSHYIDESNAPLYPFGYGLSYTDFTYSNLSVENMDDAVSVSVTVTNAGNWDGEEVAQLYIHDKVASLVRPIRELKGFEKIALAKGESRQVSFTLTPKELGFYDQEGIYRVEPGSFDIYVGGSSAAELKASFDWPD